jgi:hypothetical protein
MSVNNHSRLELNPSLTLSRPYSQQEQRQTLLLSRIIKNVDLLNESLEELGRSLDEINTYNEGNAEVADMWENVSLRQILSS